MSLEKIKILDEALAVMTGMQDKDMASDYGRRGTAEQLSKLAQSDADSPREKKKKEREMQRLVEEAARAMRAALDGFDKAFESAGKLLAGMSLTVKNIKNGIDRLDFLMEQITQAGELLKGGTKEEKELWLLLNGVDQAEIDKMSQNGTLDDGIKKIRADMAEEYLPLHKKVAQDAEKYQELEKEYLDEDAKMAESIAKAEQALEEPGLSDEKIAANKKAIQEMKDARAEKTREFEITKGVFVENMKHYAEMHGEKALHEVVTALDKKDQDNSYFKLTNNFERAANPDATEVIELKNDASQKSKPVTQTLTNMGLNF